MGITVVINALTFSDCRFPVFTESTGNIDILLCMLAIQEKENVIMKFTLWAILQLTLLPFTLQKHHTGLQIDIIGTEGVLRVTNAYGFENKDDNSVAVICNGVEIFENLPVPAEYMFLPVSHLDARSQCKYNQ